MASPSDPWRKVAHHLTAGAAVDLRKNMISDKLLQGDGLAAMMPPSTDRRMWLTDPRDRRTEPRANTSLVATLRVEGREEFPVVVLDLSSEGALLETDAPPNLDARYSVTFSVYGDTYCTELRVLHWARHKEDYLWGCQLHIPADDARRLRRAVSAALGMASTEVRPWEEIHEQVRQPSAAERIVVGRTPAGHVIEVAVGDVAEMGPEGVDLFVRTVASLESM
jgi:hypothetical protein